MNPVTTSNQIQEQLQNYIRRTLPVERAMPTFKEPLDKLFKEYPLAQDPFLEIMPGYKAEESLQNLVEEGIIHQETAVIFAKAFNRPNAAEVKIYSHQAKSIRAVCKDDKNLIVCSGTGSGKTECFLIPLVDYLVGEWIEAGRPDPWDASGVRAMILYPMNALVNDQIRRLRGILRHAPYITFGKYTGELASVGDEDTLRQQLARGIDQHKQALESASEGVIWSHAGFDDEAPLRNEVTLRSEWHTSPAHILVTNYSMLERLLLQPETSRLFNNPWKFIVLDEAHCYDGALGTEIAWLIRRLKKRIGSPEHLRFMATSATLIDDPDLNIDQKSERIRNEFASQIFPATPESFSVQFGEPLPHVSVEDAYVAPAPLTGDIYRLLVDSTLNEQAIGSLRNKFETFSGIHTQMNETDRLFNLSQIIMGTETWLNRLDKAVELARQDLHPMAVGDALYIARAINDADTCKLLQVINVDAVKKGMLEGAVSLASLQRLVAFVVAGIGGLKDNDKWRERLHDYGDPRPSSIARDTDRNENRQKRYGNRLHVRTEWEAIQNGDPTQLTIEGLSYLLKTAEALVIDVEDEQNIQMPEPMTVKVAFSESATRVIRSFIERHADLNKAVREARLLLTDAWKNKLLEITGPIPQSENKIEVILAWFLGKDSNLSALSEHLRTAMSNPAANADLSKYKIVARAIFGEDQRADDYLDALISLGSMGLHPQTRRPLVDIRYHQLIRGLREVGISFLTAEEFKLQPTDALTTGEGESRRSIFTLGVCRTCGQPFALGYTDIPQLNKGSGIKLLSRIKTEQQKYLHAIAWKEGQDFEEAEAGFPKPADAQVHLNIQTGQIAIGTPQPRGEGWIRGYWYVKTSNENSEFLEECPCCGGSHNRPQENRFGIITPYESNSERFKLTLLDELIRKTDPSADPAARAHPGEGRKLLAFSDSRRGAASLAYRYQELFNTVSMGRFIQDGVTLLQQQPVNQDILEAVRNLPALAGLIQGWSLLVNKENPAVAQVVHNQIEQLILEVTQRSDLDVNSVSLQHVIEENNCIRLLEMSDSNGADMKEVDAAKIRLLQVLRKKGRYSLFRKNVLKLESKALNEVSHNNGIRSDFLRQFDESISSDQLYSMCNEILLHLFERAFMTVEIDWPVEEINHENNHRFVTRTRGDGTFGFVSNAHNSGLNRIVLTTLGLSENQAGRRQANAVLDVLWILFSQNLNGNQVLIDSGNGLYQYNHSDIVIRPGVGANDFEDPRPFEKYDAYLADRNIIPVRIEEHTAQLANERGSAYQKAFASGRINILSCSTTFEMGVDLGDLTCVFLNNLPPGVSNYRQRAGRAGRRPGSVAYVLSFVGNTPHEQYYFDRPAKLLFGRVRQPKIYLNNSVFRARHLRAEALYHFLSWMVERRETNGTKWDNNIEGGGVIPSIKRNWQLMGHFFVGRRAASVQIGGQWNRRVTATFTPIVEEISSWCTEKRNNLSEYIEQIDDVPIPLGYSVADDLVWQLKTQNPTEIAPYDLNTADNVLNYAKLAGPNQPEVNNGRLQVSAQTARREVQKRVQEMYNGIGYQNNPDNMDARPPRNISKPQLHLLNEQTIMWLTRNRVLPKYGFPVDVIRLLPHESDPHGRNVELERDRKIGLFEYAPGQIVMADKRIYEVEDIKVFLPGGINAPEAARKNFYLCDSCYQPHEALPENRLCTSCGSQINNDPDIAIQPDAFQSKVSRAGNAGIPKERGTPLKVFTGGIKGTPVTVEMMNMSTAESYTGELLYLNFGPGYQGFPQISIQGQKAKLYHQVKTDIAVWLPNANLFNNGGALYDMARNPARLKAAMQSALEAILRAVAIELQISDKEIGGITYPATAGQIGFVLFDESSGGGGAVMPLVLTGDKAIDDGKNKQILEIIKKAIDLCMTCEECNQTIRFENLGLGQTPVSRNEMLAENPPPNSRERQSCYKCLRTYGNQRVHHLLDRGDAVVVLNALLTPSPQQPMPAQETQNQDSPLDGVNQPFPRKVEGKIFEMFDKGSELSPGSSYLLNNGKIVIYRVGCGIEKTQVIGQEVE